MASPLSGDCSRTLSASFRASAKSSRGQHNNEPAVRDFERYLGPAHSPLPEMRGAQRCPIVQPHCSDSFECKSILWVELHHVEVAHLCFVVVAGFEIIVGLGEKACLLGFLGAASDQRNRQSKRYDSEIRFSMFACGGCFDFSECLQLFVPWRCQVFPLARRESAG